MDNPRDAYKRNAGNANIRKEAFSTYTKKYVKGEENEFFLQLHEGSKITRTSKPFFVPGRVYTYEYTPLHKDALAYYDKRPIVMVHEMYTHPVTKNELLVGINLNFLPEKVRVAVLQFYFEKFEADINNSEKTFWEGGLSLASQKVIAFLKDWLMQLKIFESRKISFGFAYRQYITNRIRDAVLIEYDDWQLLPFLHPKDITGAQLAEIYNSYDSSLQKNLNNDRKKISKGRQ